MRYLLFFLETVHGDGTGDAMKAVGAERVQAMHAFAEANAASIWAKSACVAPRVSLTPGQGASAEALFGLNWRGSCEGANGSPNAATQISALDTFLAARSFSCAQR
jgi:hypothetical protein